MITSVLAMYLTVLLSYLRNIITYLLSSSYCHATRVSALNLSVSGMRQIIRSGSSLIYTICRITHILFDYLCRGITMSLDYETPSVLFKALSHPVRLQIAHLLSLGEECVQHLAAAMDKPQPYISQQLGILRDAGLIADHKEGLWVYYRITDHRLELLLYLALPGASRSRIGPGARCRCPRCGRNRRPSQVLSER